MANGLLTISFYSFSSSWWSMFNSWIILGLQYVKHCSNDFVDNSSVKQSWWETDDWASLRLTGPRFAILSDATPASARGSMMSTGNKLGWLSNSPKAALTKWDETLFKSPSTSSYSISIGPLEMEPESGTCYSARCVFKIYLNLRKFSWILHLYNNGLWKGQMGYFLSISLKH